MAAIASGQVTVSGDCANVGLDAAARVMNVKLKQCESRMTCPYLPETHMHLRSRGSREGFDETLAHWVIDDSEHNRDRFRITMWRCCRPVESVTITSGCNSINSFATAGARLASAFIHRLSMCGSMPSDQPSSRKS